MAKRPPREDDDERDGDASSGEARLTLELTGPPLTLPGEPAPPPEDDEGTDAWHRGRPRVRPMRPRSMTPPPGAAVDALELVARNARTPSAPNAVDFTREMNERFALGDFSGALRVAELVLGRDPADSAAKRCASECRGRLEQLHETRLEARLGGRGPVASRALRVGVPEREIRWLGLDHRQAFLLSRIEQGASLAELEDVAGMSRLDLLRALVELAEMGAIEGR